MPVPAMHVTLPARRLGWMTSVRASGAMAEQNRHCCRNAGEFRRLVPGLEVEGWSNDDLRGRRAGWLRACMLVMASRSAHGSGG